MTCTFCTCMNKPKQSNRGYLCMTALIRCLLLMAAWYCMAAGHPHWTVSCASSQLSCPFFSTFIFPTHSLIPSSPTNNQSDVSPRLLAIVLQYAESVSQQHFNGAEHQCGLECQCRLPSRGVETAEVYAPWPWYYRCGWNGLWLRLRLLWGQKKRPPQWLH